jgi:hypothetical protein
LCFKACLCLCVGLLVLNDCQIIAHQSYELCCLHSVVLHLALASDYLVFHCALFDWREIYINVVYLFSNCLVPFFSICQIKSLSLRVQDSGHLIICPLDQERPPSKVENHPAEECVCIAIRLKCFCQCYVSNALRSLLILMCVYMCTYVCVSISTSATRLWLDAAGSVK